jgi:hypothetical protein
MILARRLLARVAPSVFVLVSLLPNAVAAGDQLHREPRPFRGKCASCPRYRETNHGHLHYGCTSYWASGDIVSIGDATGAPSAFMQGIAPSPWAYRSIAPYSFHYQSREGLGWCESYDCRN